MQYYLMHKKGYKFTDRIQNLTRIQMTYLTKAEEIHQEVMQYDDLSGLSGKSLDDFKNKNLNQFKSTKKPPTNSTQQLKQKVREKRKQRGG